MARWTGTTGTINSDSALACKVVLIHKMLTNTKPLLALYTYLSFFARKGTYNYLIERLS